MKTITEHSPAFELSWSFGPEPTAPGVPATAYVLEYAVTANEELYIEDRLWDGNVTQSRYPDPYGVYRFVQNGSLRLVFTQAPLPPHVRVGNYYVPLFSKIGAGETRKQTVKLSSPIVEYSALARNVKAESVIDSVSRIYFVMGYRLRSTLEKDPEPPSNETAEKAGYKVFGSTLLISQMNLDVAVPVQRRTVYMARLPSPGEPPVAPAPLGALG